MNYYDFSEVVYDITSTFHKIQKSDYLTEGKYKVMSYTKKLCMV